MPVQVSGQIVVAVARRVIWREMGRLKAGYSPGSSVISISMVARTS
jgi:hypothetical protein